MNFKKIFSSILGEKNLTEKAKNNQLSTEDWDTIASAFKEKTGKDIYAAIDEAEQNATKAAAHDKAMALFSTEENSSNENSDNSSTDDPENTDLTTQVQNLTEQNKTLIQENKDKDAKIKKLGGNLEDDDPENITTEININGMGHTETHVFGIQHDFFATSSRHNKIMLNPAYSKLNPADEEEDAPKFHAAVVGFGKKLAKRYQELHSRNELATIKSSTSTTVGLPASGDGIGDAFLTRRMDAIIARIASIPDIDFLPTRSNIQDMEVLFNSLFDEVSQAWQPGKVFKGEVKIEPETGHVDDVSIKLRFAPLVDLERKYIGYLNKQGSDPIKWTMIEWMIVGVLEQAVNERKMRKVLGIYVKPETGKPGLAINGSTGMYYTLLRYQWQNKLLPMSDSAYADFDDVGTNMYDAVKAFIKDVSAKLGDRDIADFTLVLPKCYKEWWVDSLRAKFSKDNDFSGPKADKVPDTEVGIYWMPVVTQKFMVLAKKDNLQALENVPGEMYLLKLKEDFEDVLARSRFKEGVAADFVGPKFNSKADLVANDYEMQQIFINKPVSKLADDATVVNASATKNFYFETQANSTSGKKITDITGAKKGVAYIIECGSDENPQAIEKTDKFSTITKAYAPTKVGDYIMVILNSDGDKFFELERTEGGVRSVNKLLQPTLPESRN